MAYPGTPNVDRNTPAEAGVLTKPVVHRMRRAALFEKLGSGLITGAADDDPSGIATYSLAGAQFGFNMFWTMFFLYPMMSTMQMGTRPEPA